MVNGKTHKIAMIKKLVDYYAKKNYYAQGDGTMRVYGEMATLFGFKDGQQIDEKGLTSFLKAEHIDGTDLFEAAKHRRGAKRSICCYELTFSPSKAVSIACGVRKDARVLRAWEKTVKQVMAEFHSQYIGKQYGEVTGKAAYVSVTDHKTRTTTQGGAQVGTHTHTLTQNATVDDQGNIYSADGRRILQTGLYKALDGRMNALLLENLKAENVEEAYMTADGVVKLSDVSAEAEAHFSQRSRDIKEAESRITAKIGEAVKLMPREAARFGLDQSEAVGTLVGKGSRGVVRKDGSPSTHHYLTVAIDDGRTVEVAAVLAEGAAWDLSRGGKDTRSDAEIETEWKDQLAAIERQTTPEVVAAEREKEAEQRAAAVEMTDAERWQAAACIATDKQALAEQHAVIAEYMKLRNGAGEQAVTIAEAQEKLTAEIGGGRLAADGKGLVTTWELVEAERRTLAVAADKVKPIMTKDEATAFVNANGGRLNLDDGQRAMVIMNLSSDRRMTAVQGYAGAGKSHAAALEADGYRAKGCKVVAAAPTGAAAVELGKKIGEEGRTVESLLMAAQSRPNNDGRGNEVWIVDEATMLDSRTYGRLADEIKRLDIRCPAMGDTAQQGSVGAGDMFRDLQTQAKELGAYAEVSHLYRQKEPILKAAVEQMQVGDFDGAWKTLDTSGVIREISDPDERRKFAVDFYQTHAEIKGGAAILVSTNWDRLEVGDAIRADLVERGKIDDRRSVKIRTHQRTADGCAAETLRLAPGDRIELTENDRKLGVVNGTTGTVKSVTGERLTFAADDGRTVSLDLSKYDSIRHGYAVTTMKAQGRTITAVCVHTPDDPHNIDRASVYGPLTRAVSVMAVTTSDNDAYKKRWSIDSQARSTRTIDADLEHARAGKTEVAETIAEQRAAREQARTPQQPAQQPQERRERPQAAPQAERPPAAPQEQPQAAPATTEGERRRAEARARQDRKRAAEREQERTAAKFAAPTSKPEPTAAERKAAQAQEMTNRIAAIEAQLARPEAERQAERAANAAEREAERRKTLTPEQLTIAEKADAIAADMAARRAAQPKPPEQEQKRELTKGVEAER